MTSGNGTLEHAKAFRNVCFVHPFFARLCMYAGASLAIILLLSSICMSAVAADDRSDLSIDPINRSGEYTAVLYNNSNGLPTSEANAILQASDGFIWIGSYAGLMRYDGDTFERIDSTNGVASVVSLYEDTQNRLWVGTNDNGIAVMKDGVFRMLKKDDGLPSSSVKGIIGDRNDNIYLGTTNGLAYIDSDMHVHEIDHSKLSNPYVYNLEIDQNDIVYGTTMDGMLFSIRDGVVESTWTFSGLGLGEGAFHCMLPDHDHEGYFYLGSEGSDLYYGNPEEGGDSFRTINVTPLTDITDIHQTGGDVWITADNGVGIIRDGEFHQVENLPMNNKIDSMTVDYQGNLWFTSSRQGIMKIVRNQFTDLYEQYQLPADTVNTTCLLDDHLYIGTDTGLRVLYNGDVMKYLPVKTAMTASGKPIEDMVNNNLISWLDGCRIRSIIHDSKNRLWISTFKSKGLICIDGENMICYTEEDGMPSNRIRTVFEDGDRILVACTGGVVEIRENQIFQIYRKQFEGDNTEILTVCATEDGTILAGTDGDGIYIIRPEKTVHILAGNGLNSDIVMRIKKDLSRDLYWIVTSNSIAHLNPDNNQVTTIHKFPYSNNFDLYENKEGRVWVLSSDGIYITSVDELLANQEITASHIGISDGLPHIATGNSYSEITPTGDLYIAGATGVCKVNINSSVYDQTAVKLSVPYIIADGETIYPLEDGSFVVPTNVTKLTIQGRAFIYTMNNPKISCYLDGFDRAPIIMKRDEMSARDYTNLEGGNYHFIMQVMDSNDEQNGSISVLIRKERALYERSWFKAASYLLPVLLVGLSILLYFRLRIRKTQRQRKMEMEYRKSGLSSMLELYKSIYIIDLVEDTIAPVERNAEDDKLRPKELSPTQQIQHLFQVDAMEQYQTILREFGDLATIQTRMSQRNSVVVEYESKNLGWCRIQFIAMDRRPGEPVEKLLFTIRQINEEKQELDNVKGEVAKAESENKAKSAFLANMSHEIRTPINAVLGLDTMILRESKEDQIRAYARDIKSAGSMLLSLVNTVLDFSKLEAGKMELVPAEYSLRSLINDLRTIIRPRLDEHHLEFEIDVTESIPDRLYGDDVRLKQIIMNLLTNAAKYTEKGKVRLGIYGKQKDEETLHLLISVKDSGMGIRKDDLKKLTERFARIDEERNRKVEGTGIGMNLVGGLLELMDSELRVASIYGRGSDFYFEVDQKIVDPTPIGDYRMDDATKDEEEYSATFTAPDAHVLVVDDTEINRMVFTDLLKETELKIDEADSGKAALNLTLQNHYDIIFMDHMMPGMDGVETMQRIRKQDGGKNRDSIIIVLTANNAQGAKEEYTKLGFDDFMAKPLNPKALEQMIMDLLPEGLCRIGSKSMPEDDHQDVALPTIDGVDFMYALQHVGSKEGVLNVMKQFVQVADSERDELSRYWNSLSENQEDEEALTSYRIKVHAMKTSASLCGALQVYGVAARLEQAAIKHSIEEILTLTPYFVSFWTELKLSLSAELGVLLPEQEKTGSVEREKLETFLHQLQTCMNHYDVNGADEIIHNLDQYRMDEHQTDMFAKLKVAVANLDADGCRELCEQFF